MRAWDAAVAAMALRTACPREDRKPDPRLRKLAPAIDDAGAALNDRRAVDQSRAALIASLWPAPTRQCVAAPVYLQQKAPAVFSTMYVLGRRRSQAQQTPDARSLQARLERAFGPPAADEKAAAAAKTRAA
jgi:hypothetical protein